MRDYESIVTHNDFDGVVSAALLSWAFDLDEIRFTGPIAVQNAEIPITARDIVSDLPYPLECGLWFDHHAGNLESVKLRGLDPSSIAGRFAIAPSCVRVVYDYLLDQYDEVPDDFAELADVSDLIDSFSYPTMEDWRADTAANRIDRAIKANSANRYAHERFLRDLVFMFRDLPLADIAEDPEIVRRAQEYARDELKMLEHIEKYGRFLPEDSAHELYVIDTTSFLQPARIDKKLVGLVHPGAMGYVELKSNFRSGKKSLDISLSLSLALSMQQSRHSKDMGEIVRLMNVGDGHAGAAAGVYPCKSGHEYQNAREELAHKIFELWRKM